MSTKLYFRNRKSIQSQMLVRRIYSIWAIFSIASLFFVLAIPLLFIAPFYRLHPIALKLNYWWAVIFFRMAFIPVKKEWHFEPDPKQQYILCANHFSYLDIPALGLFPYPFKFVGKSQLKKIPLFGIMYDLLHITVDRKSYRSRAHTLEKCRVAMKYRFNLGFFPEGGIRFSEYPNMIRFQEGAFRLASEYNVPIVPVTMPSNHFIFPDDDRFLFFRTTCKLIYHEPVWPYGKSDQEIKQLKDHVFRVIQSELEQQHFSTSTDLINN